MRIENTARSSNVSRGGGVSRSSGNGGFFVADEPAMSQTAATAPIAESTGIAALLALQLVEDPLFAKRKAIRRGHALLDTLETIKADLLLGRVSEGRLNQLMVLITSAREQNPSNLDGILDDIELRARVELAKFGRFPSP